MRLDKPLDLITQMIQGLYDAENQLVLALPHVALRVANPALAESVRNHLDETKLQAKRLEQLAAALGINCDGRTCFAMQGLLKEGENSMGSAGDVTLVDAAIIAACQGIEHFELSQYNALLQLCEKSGLRHIADVLQITLAEEEQASMKLDEIALESLQTLAAASDDKLDAPTNP